MRTRASYRSKSENGVNLSLFLPNHFYISRLSMHQQLTLDVVYGFIQCIPEFLKIFFVEEDLMLLIFFFPYSFALGNRDVEVLLRLGGFHIKEVRSFTGSHPFCEDFIFVRVFQGRTTSLQRNSLEFNSSQFGIRPSALRIWRPMFYSAINNPCPAAMPDERQAGPHASNALRQSGGRIAQLEALFFTSSQSPPYNRNLGSTGLISVICKNYDKVNSTRHDIAVQVSSIPEGPPPSLRQELRY